jgi:hypothetical protein
MELLTCTRCKTEKPATAEAFPLHNKKRNGLDSWCRECRATYRSENCRGKHRAVISDEVLKEILTLSRERNSLAKMSTAGVAWHKSNQGATERTLNKLLS